MSEKLGRGQVTPEKFFDEVVPEVFSLTKDARKNAKGTCEVQLFGNGNPCWTLDLASGTVKKGRGQNSDFYMEMTHEDFTALIADKLNVEEALRNGRIRVKGKVPVLLHLSMILKPRTMEY